MADRGVIDLRRLAGAVAAVPRATIVEAVEGVKRIANGTAPPFTRARPGSSYPLRSYDDIVDNGTGLVFGRIQGVPVGFWSMATYGTKRHRLPKAKSARYSRAPRLGKRRLLSFGPEAGAAWGPVKHPGATGRGYWDRVVDRATPGVLATFDAAVDKAVGT